MRNAVFKQYGLRAVIWVFVSYWSLLFVWLRLKLSKTKWLRTQVDFNSRLQGHHQNSVTNDPKLKSMHEIVRLAARLHVIRLDCLPKSIVLKKRLINAGFTARVVIGVGKSGENFASHAWVDVLLDNVWHMVAEPETVAKQFSRI